MKAMVGSGVRVLAYPNFNLGLGGVYVAGGVGAVRPGLTLRREEFAVVVLVGVSETAT